MGTRDFRLRGNHSDMQLITCLHLVQRLRKYGAAPAVSPQLPPAVTYCSICVWRGHVACAVRLTTATVCQQLPGAVTPVDTLPHGKVTSLHGCTVRLTAVNLAPDVIMEPRISEETDQWAEQVERREILKDRCLLQYNSPYVVARLATCQGEKHFTLS
jgi:hypothetical protein